MAPVTKLTVERLRSANSNLIMISVLFLGIGGWLIYANIRTVQDNAAVIGVLSGIIIIALTLLFFVAPIVRGHLITQTKLILRFGVLFRFEVPLSNIAEMNVLENYSRVPVLMSIGVRYSRIDRRYIVLVSRREVVRLKLRREMTEGRLWTRSVEEILFDTLDSEELRRRILRTGFTE